MKFNLTEIIKDRLPKLKKEYEYIVWVHWDDCIHFSVDVSIKSTIPAPTKPTYLFFKIICGNVAHLSADNIIYFKHIDEIKEDRFVEYIDKKYLKETKENNYDK